MMEKEITIIRIGFMASVWSDVKTYGTLIAMYGVNEHLLNGNNWVDFILMILFALVIIARTAGSKFVHKFKTNEDAIAFLEGRR